MNLQSLVRALFSACTDSCTYPRFTLANVLPPVFITLVISTIWSVYVGLHLVPMLQGQVKDERPAVAGLVDLEFGLQLARLQRLDQQRLGLVQLVISQLLTSALVVCFVRSMLTHPGTVPNHPMWRFDTVESAEGAAPSGVRTREVKTSGGRRFCKWCQLYKPDRCHHCRFCKSCVLRMDHHCPWIMNCVGFRNHKFFFLLVVYGVLDCIFILLTISSSVQRAVDEETPSRTRFLLVLALMLTLIMGMLLMAFLAFHVWLMLSGMTTIEFFEKSMPKTDRPTTARVETQSYKLDWYRNLKNVLGPRPWLWFIPLDPPVGDGISFPTLQDDFEPKASRAGGLAQPEWTGFPTSTP